MILKIISQLLYGIIFWSALFLAYQFYLTKDGWLRKLEILYFTSVAACFGFSGGFYFFWDLGYFQGVNQIIIRVISDMPKAIAMLLMVKYFLDVKKKPGTNECSPAITE